MNWKITVHFILLGCLPCVTQVHMLLLQQQRILILFSDEIILVRLQLLFLTPESCYVSW